MLFFTNLFVLGLALGSTLGKSIENSNNANSLAGPVYEYDVNPPEKELAGIEIAPLVKPPVLETLGPIKSLKNDILKNVKVPSNENCAKYQQKIVDVCRTKYQNIRKMPLVSDDPTAVQELPNGDKICRTLKNYVECLLVPMNAVCDDPASVIETALADNRALTSVCQTYFPKSFHKKDKPRTSMHKPKLSAQPKY